MPKPHPPGRPPGDSSGGGDDGNPPPPPRRPPSGGGPDDIPEGEGMVRAAAMRGRAGTGGSAEPAGPGGPPWPTSASMPGSAHGKDLLPPHRRHTINGSRSGQIQEENTVYLRGHESAAAQDVQSVAAGEAVWNTVTQRYEINGRSYGVEANGRVFPDSGVGMVKLDRNEYAALKEIVRADGDLSAAPQLSRNPRFTANPEAVTKAKAIYDGTYEP